MSAETTKPFYLKYPVPRQLIYQGIVCGTPYTTTDFKEDVSRIRDFEVRETDVVIASYPRTGSRWLCEMVSWISVDGEEIDQRSRLKSVSMFKVPQMEDAIPEEVKQSDDEEILFIDQLSKIPADKQRIYSTHLQLRLAPRELAEKCKVICSTFRNPKDNAVSFCHLYQIGRRFGFYQGPWEDFLAGYVQGEVMCGSYFDWLKCWWPKRQNKNVLFLRYEEMKKDHAGTVKKVAHFLGKKLDEKRIQKIVEKTSFKAMQESPLTNHARNEYFIKRGIFKAGSNHVRKGEVGDWKNYFTVRQNEEFDKLVKEKLAGLNLEFEYSL